MMSRGWRIKRDRYQIRTFELVVFERAAETCPGNQKSEEFCQNLLQSPKRLSADWLQPPTACDTIAVIP